MNLFTDSKLKVVLNTMRPSFLILTPACVLLGFSTSIISGTPIDSSLLVLVLAGAIFAHICVNMLNEYFDFKSGLDFKTVKTPFSGGSGALPNNPNIANLVLTLGLTSLFITIAIGIYFIFITGPHIIPIGLVGLALIITYTQLLNRFPFLCLIAPGLGFGVLMVVGTHIILSAESSALVWQVSLIPFFLTNNLLLLNQYPDIKADASVGRNTFPIAFGIAKSNIVYAIFMIATYSLILFYVLAGYLPIMSVVALFPLALSVFALFGAIKHKSSIGDAPQYLAANVAATIITPVLLTISILYS